MTSVCIGVTIADRDFTLCSPGGIYDPSTETLFIADTHFGKDASFRHHAIPVPTGSTEATLRKIEKMLCRLPAKRLVILGDMFHDRNSLSKETLKHLDEFFETYQWIDHFLVPGNHDSDIRFIPKHWSLQIIQSGTYLDGLTLSHFPVTSDEMERIVLCGHLHPAIRIGTGNDQLKLPCFLYRDQNLILPALGDFTGTEVIRTRSGDRVWVIADEEVVTINSEF